MKFIFFILAAFVSVISADTLRGLVADVGLKKNPTAAPTKRPPTKLPSKTPTRAPVMPLKSGYSFDCLSFGKAAESHIGQLNGNTGAILDRLNIRCSANMKQSQDIGVPIGTIQSPKSQTISLPTGAKGWDTVVIGYGMYDARQEGQLNWSVASIRVCAAKTCYDMFINGLSICSADATKDYACQRLETYNYANTGKIWTGIKNAQYYNDNKNGYIVSFTPTFA